MTTNALTEPDPFYPDELAWLAKYADNPGSGRGVFDFPADDGGYGVAALVATTRPRREWQ